MYEVYITKSLKYNRYYIGHALNANERLLDHNYGRVRSTKAYRPWVLVYKELWPDKQSAYKRELQIKSYKHGEAFKNLIQRRK